MDLTAFDMAVISIVALQLAAIASLGQAYLTSGRPRSALLWIGFSLCYVVALALGVFRESLGGPSGSRDRRLSNRRESSSVS